LRIWNVANLGHPEQQRREKDFELIAELLGWFELVAFQEVKWQPGRSTRRTAVLAGQLPSALLRSGGKPGAAGGPVRLEQVRLLVKVGEIAAPSLGVPGRDVRDERKVVDDGACATGVPLSLGPFPTDAVMQPPPRWRCRPLSFGGCGGSTIGGSGIYPKEEALWQPRPQH
jgi:hypothetical protein